VDKNSADWERTIPYQNVVITDVDGSALANELCAAAIRHIEKKGGGFTEFNHDPVPINDPRNLSCNLTHSVSVWYRRL
jgi:hypothetical protein